MVFWLIASGHADISIILLCLAYFYEIGPPGQQVLSNCNIHQMSFLIDL